MAKKSKPAETESAPTTGGDDQITIAGIVFNVPLRYSAGHVLSEGEASALNQTYHENLRNNFAKEVKSAKTVPAEGDTPASTRELTEADISDLQSKLNAYAESYQFGVRAVGSARTPADPVGREAINLAKAAIRAKLAERKISASAEQVADLAAKLVEKDPQFRVIAEQRVASAKAIANVSLDALS